MNVITYNIKYDTYSNEADAWSNRKDDVVTLLKFHGADVFCVQEALYDQVKDIKREMRQFDYVGVGRDDGGKKGEYSAVFYNAKQIGLLDSGSFWLSETPEKPGLGWDAAYPRICTWGRLKDIESGQEFFVFNTHFDHKGSVARLKSAKLICEKVQEIGEGNLPAILTGDFNLTPEEEAIAFICYEWNDSFKVSEELPYGPEGTFNGFTTAHPLDKRIDYIFVNSMVRVLRYAVLTDSKQGRYPSDHLPVFTELTFK